jgi:hypothetical protein
MRVLMMQQSYLHVVIIYLRTGISHYPKWELWRKDHGSVVSEHMFPLRLPKRMCVYYEWILSFQPAIGQIILMSVSCGPVECYFTSLILSDLIFKIRIHVLKDFLIERRNIAPSQLLEHQNGQQIFVNKLFSTPSLNLSFTPNSTGSWDFFVKQIFLHSLFTIKIWCLWHRGKAAI